jgi:hypothetical protein
MEIPVQREGGTLMAQEKEKAIEKDRETTMATEGAKDELLQKDLDKLSGGGDIKGGSTEIPS